MERNEALSETPDYETYSCEEVGEAWQKLRKQIQNQHVPLVWTGPDRLHHAIAAGSPPPSEKLNERNREAERDQGRDIWDTLFLIAFQIGFHHGTVQQEKQTKFYQDIDESWHLEYVQVRAKLQALCPHERSESVDGLHGKKQVVCRECRLLMAEQE